MSIDIDSSEFNVNGKCAPRNVLFCCRSPICVNNNSPKLVPPTPAMDQTPPASTPPSSVVHPVRVPDLSDPMFYTNLMAQPTATDTTASEAAKNVNPINKSQSAQDVRHGVSLRRVTPPKCTVTVKKSDAPMMGVVLRKVEKNLLAPPKPAKHEKSPPPRKLTNAVTALGLSTSKASTSASASASAKSKKSNTSSAANNNQSAAIAKSKSTNDVHGKPPKDKVSSAAPLTTCTSAVDLKPPPPVNLLKTHRPPLEIHKIEGDKIIIIRRVPRSRRGAGQEPPKSTRSLPTLQLPLNQVTHKCRHFANPCPSHIRIPWKIHARRSLTATSLCPPTAPPVHRVWFVSIVASWSSRSFVPFVSAFSFTFFSIPEFKFHIRFVTANVRLRRQSRTAHKRTTQNKHIHFGASQNTKHMSARHHFESNGETDAFVEIDIGAFDDAPKSQ